MLYQASGASKYFGADTVFENIQFEIKGTEKIAIVGRNGCGKTTFLRCMAEEEKFDKGTISRPNSLTIGYLAQKALSHDDWTVRQELEVIYQPVFDLEKQMKELEKVMEHDASEDVLNRYAALQERYESLNGYNWQSEMKTVFTRFGFSMDELDKKIGEFSGGGWKAMSETTPEPLL